MRYSRRTLNHLERIVLYDPTHLISMVDPMAIGLETQMIDSLYSLEKEFTELIHINLLIVLCQNLSRFIHVTIMYVVL